ncbi:MAG: lycopene cyclase, partial [Sphingobacteriales bacterium]
MTSEAHTSTYDYIFSGAGCAGLSLLYHMIGAGLVEGKRILLVDADRKEANDRTWCFWEQGRGPFEDIVHRRWPQLDFYAPGFHRSLEIAPYQYKLIRGADFYRHVRQAADPFPNIEFRRARIERVFSSADEGTGIVVEGETLYSRFVFNSLYQKPGPKPGVHWLLQHFKGRLIETPEARFDTGRATLMDFRVNQSEGTTFVYVLPFSERQALVEYTLFTEKLLAPEAYDSALNGYIRDFLEIDRYEILEEEFGVIPMTNHRFPRRQHNMLFLGTAGGQTKGSSGYTFRNIQRHSADITASLQQHGNPFQVPAAGRRFHFYDAVLLDVLQQRSL